MNKKLILGTAAFALTASALIANPAFAQTTTASTTLNQIKHKGLRPIDHRPAAVGKVSSINGNTITITSLPPRLIGKHKQNDINNDAASTTPITYTVDATNAAIYKDGATSTVSSINVADIIIVQGTVTGTNVSATTIHDGNGVEHGFLKKAYKKAKKILNKHSS